MGDLRSKLRAKFPRRNSGIPSLSAEKSGNDSTNCAGPEPAAHGVKEAGTATAVAAPQHDASHTGSPSDTRQATTPADGQSKYGLRHGAEQPSATRSADVGDAAGGQPSASGSAANSSDRAKNATNSPLPAARATQPSSPAPAEGHDLNRNSSRISTVSRLSSVNETPADSSQHSPRPPGTAPIDEAKPTVSTDAARRAHLGDPPSSVPPTSNEDPAAPTPNPSLRPPNTATRPAAPPRRQSLLPSRQTTLIRTLLSAAPTDDPDPAAIDQLLPISANMVTRKLWVKRPGGSATLVTISEEDLVDDVRELILRKYANSLGRHYDAPDLTLRIIPREQHRQDRVLGPEEPMARTLDAYYPGGQTVDEALLIDVPLRRTPRSSPRTGPPHAQHLTSAHYEEVRPPEAGTDYFGPGAVAHIPVTITGAAANGTTHAISVLNTGQVPQIPSPGGTRTRQYRERSDRPRLGRQHTSSPTILNVVGAGGHPATIAVATGHGMQQRPSSPRSRTHSNASAEQVNPVQAVPPPAPPLPTPPAQETAPPVAVPRTASPAPRPASPRPAPPTRPKKKKTADPPPALPAGILNGGVPPINVLIVEDNIINLRLLEAFVKRLKVRWQTAMNGREAVTKWRAGGFHLVLMDIQLPVMSGLEATREIRRLERMNSIGAFSTVNNSNNHNNSSSHARNNSSAAGGGGEADEVKNEMPEEDKLANRELFKSPVIIVALTASSLQSDRHEALAAGCNDFLTKPVTYVWLERKVMEWGCMQALIDFDGWRKWKSYSNTEGEDGAAKKTKAKKVRSEGWSAQNSSSSDQ
ncbi:hypothetical protein VTK56DRAFT_8362 [Thermocarpiscus australiensis]